MIVELLQFVLMVVRLRICPGSLKKYMRKDGENWALITGASDGIGKGISHRFAKAGLNLLIISRTESKLEALAKELTEKYKVKVEYLALDVAGNPKALDITWDFITAKVQPGDLRIAMNNVGMNMDVPAPIGQHTDDEIDRVIRVNCGYTTNMVTRFVRSYIPPKTGRYLLINMGSALGRLPTPYLAVYSASKAYINALSTAVSAEYPNLDVKAFTPFYVASPMTLTSRTNNMFISPRHFADLVVRSLNQKTVITNPHWYHALYHIMLSTLPESLRLSVTVKQMKVQQKKIIRKLKRDGRLAPQWEEKKSE
ncbi:Glucose/ribitol dehydrogenase [Carpediemonas membranifera]|uniref:Glucose/ribitol dehydrogenase n=1 Tax=Carpediemonas membranifera TaxID=201153 RepID=A0A8J6E9D4_9EUKA|nr:Glucose/ribitol dehydrogenase [Carpediemonas membranifera]|eukprot:KAG9393175.1 Glucose/ribitol dehydrogenase [Carpediemonas membranifera]